MCDPDNSLYSEYIHYKAALEAERGIVSSTTFEDWLAKRNKGK